MRKLLALFGLIFVFYGVTPGATKIHTVSFGKVNTVKWFVGPGEKDSRDLKIRALYVDTRLKEFTLGPAHEITDRLFVVRRAFRLNDALPQESAPTPRWTWQRGGWLLVDRMSGRVTAITFPDFDPYYSAVGWYRDYAAYCGVSDDGKKFYTIVAQVGRRKPILREALKDVTESEMPDSICPSPGWDRQPARVTFELKDDKEVTFTVRGHAVDIVKEDDEEVASQ